MCIHRFPNAGKGDTFRTHQHIQEAFSMSTRLLGCPKAIGTSGGCHDVWPLPLMLMDTIKGVAGSGVLPQQQPKSQMPVVPQLMPIMPCASADEFFSFPVEPPTNILYWCLF